MTPAPSECVTSPQGQGWHGLCELCGRRGTVRVWASECPGAPKRRVDESRQLCERCAEIARGRVPAPLAPRLEDLPPVVEEHQRHGRDGGRRVGRPVSLATTRSRLLVAIADGVAVGDLGDHLGISQGAVTATLYNARRARLLNAQTRLTERGMARVAELRAICQASVAAAAPKPPGLTAPPSSPVDGTALPDGGAVAAVGESGGAASDHAWGVS